MLESSTTFGQGHDGRIQLAGTAALVLSQRAAEAQKKFVIDVQQAVKASEETDRTETRQEKAEARLAANRHATPEPEATVVDPALPAEDQPEDERSQDNLDIVV